MKTNFQTPPQWEKIFLELADTMNCTNSVRPEHFKEIMRKNKGDIQMFSPFGPTEDGLERKNPVIVALGDSVTAGHFESVAATEEEALLFFKKATEGTLTEDDVNEVVDVRNSYLTKFWEKLIDKYEQTSLSIINAGIAGDSMYGMEKRVYRDVIRYQPDLVIINGSLNWGPGNGSTKDYENVLRRVLASIMQETKADIVLLTPNMEYHPLPMLVNPESSLDERVEVIRRLADEKKVCLADTYLLWKEYEKQGHPVDALLANGFNHPSVTGHEAYARVLMQLMD